MKILIEGHTLGISLKGVGHYVYRTLKELSIIDKKNDFYVSINPDVPASALPRGSNLQYIKIPYINHVMHGFLTIPRLTRNLRPDLVWIPAEYPVGFIGKPLAISIHDIPPILRNYHKIDSLRQKLIDKFDDFLLPISLRNASIVFSNSQYVADWVNKKARVRPEKICVASYGLGADFHTFCGNINRAEILQKLGMSQGYIFTIYTGEIRENIIMVLEAYQRIVDKDFKQGLIIAGVRDSIKDQVVSLISKYPCRNRIKVLPFITSDKLHILAELFNAALVYLDLSLHEGFGMQVLEAMACGTPVVCSNRTALPEVVGSAGILVDPSEPDEIVSALMKIITNDDIRKYYINLAFERAKMFSWNKTANIILTKFNSLNLK